MAGKRGGRKKVNWTRVDMLVDKTLEAGAMSLGNDIKKRAQILAPKLTGRLRRSARVDFVGTSGKIIYVMFNTPYARLRHFVNRKHPATRLYLTNSLKSIKSTKKYFKKFN